MSSMDAIQSMPQARSALATSFGASLRENSLLILLAAVFSACPLAVDFYFDLHVNPYQNVPKGYFMVLCYFAVTFFFAFLLWSLYRWRVMRNGGTAPVFGLRERLTLAIPVLAVWPMTAMSFSYLKSVMPLVNPFYLDPLLEKWDRVLHFGVAPWEILAPVLNFPWITFAFSCGYLIWFLVIKVTVMTQSMASDNRRLRMQFLLSQLLTWTLVGNLAATLMSSAGPCYYAMVMQNGTDPFAGLFAYLQHASDSLHFTLFGDEVKLTLTSLNLQSVLWEFYARGDIGFAKGISAAPSMHVATTWLVFRLALSSGRVATAFGALFLAVILIGSVHLGWHYALDGYIGILFAWIIWRLVGWALDLPAVRRLLWPDFTARQLGKAG